MAACQNRVKDFSCGGSPTRYSVPYASILICTDSIAGNRILTRTQGNGRSPAIRVNLAAGLSEDPLAGRRARRRLRGPRGPALLSAADARVQTEVTSVIN